ncbi:MAG: dihydroorotase [Firmicutes bacterium]|nr:dihydroorotase [Bacillota bacterium]
MIILRNARAISRGNETVIVDMLIRSGRIAVIMPKGDKQIHAGLNDTEIDCKEKIIMPGFIDAHVHLREPGFEEKETIRTGTEAAAAGGFTTVMPMPNLDPVPDNVQRMNEYCALIGRDAVVRAEPYASITWDEKGETVVDMRSLKQAGAIAFSDDGVGVQSDEVMAQAMAQARFMKTLIVAHTEDNSLKNGGYVHEGPYAEKMGWKGIPSACEYAQAERDIELVRQTGCRYHICHVSTKETVELVRQAKAEGLKVTCEVTPHHLTLIDEDVKDENYKMNPPLRSREDREALIEGLLDGTIDMVATDHAPHTAEEKSRGMEKAPFGIVGLETAFPVLYTELVKPGRMTLARLQEVLSETPAEVFGLAERGRIRKGCMADLVLVDPEAEYEIDPAQFKSKGKNTPFAGKKVFGKVLWTMVGGKFVYEG